MVFKYRKMRASTTVRRELYSEAMNFLLTSLLLLIVLARLLGKLFARYNQPAIVGEMLAGIILGPAVLNLIRPNPALFGISELAVFLVILSAGLEMNFRDIARVLRGRGLLVAVLGFVIPLFSGIFLGIVFGLDAMRTVFLALCISITALPVAVRILDSFKLLNSEIAHYSVATAIVNDVLALLALGVILDLPSQRSFQSIATSVFVTGGKLVLLALFILGVNWFLERAEKRGFHIHVVPEKFVEMFGNEALVSIVIVFVLIFGAVSEILGFHFVIGAFFGGLLISREFFLARRYKQLEESLASITGGFLAPVFFAYIGLEFSLREMRSAPFVIAVLAVSILSKILAGWLAGRMIGLERPHALGLGIILNGRGIMELVVASIAFKRGLIGQGMFSTLVLMGVATTMLTPILFRRFALPAIKKAES